MVIYRFLASEEGLNRMCEAVRKYGDEREFKGKQQVIQSALKMKMSLETIAELVQLPVEEVQKLIEKMEH